MASSLAEKIGREFLSCDICFESYNDPRGLPCQHGFCRECLEGCVMSSHDKRTLVCPNCRKVIKISKDGVKNLPVHFIVNKLKDAVEVDKMIKCNNCDDTNRSKATVRCMDCQQYLCDGCNASHTHLKTMRNHKVVSIEDIISGKLNLAEEKLVCEDHKEHYKYYCKNEIKAVCQDCVILKKCPPYHDRVTIDEAAQVKSRDLEYLTRKSDTILRKYQDNLKIVNDIEKELEIHSKIAKDALARVEQEYIKLVKETVKRFKDEIDNNKKEKMNKLNRKKTDLKSTMKDIEKAAENATQVIQSPNKMTVISNHTTLSTKLKALCRSQPNKVDGILGHVKFEAAIPSIPNIGQLLKDDTVQKPWIPIGQFSTGDFKILFGFAFNKLQGLALDQDDNIVVCSAEKGVKVFTRNGEVKSTLYDSPGSVDVGVLPGKRYVTAPLDTQKFKICNSEGKRVISCLNTNMNNKASHVNSLAVDSNNKIIVGQAANTISIHNADCSLVSKFATQFMPFRLAATSNGDIVSSFFDKRLNRSTSVQLMDYNGDNVRVIQPPGEVKAWSPGFVCCGQGEIFVANAAAGDPSGVYRYTSEGDYLGYVTTQVDNPSGIALSKDGMELFVADYGDSNVKIFQRP